MLRIREVLINVGGTEIAAVVYRGSPQARVLFAVLWKTVVDNLILRLNDLGYHTIGYADDIDLTEKNADINSLEEGKLAYYRCQKDLIQHFNIRTKSNTWELNWTGD